MKKIRVLILEDNVSDAELMLYQLQKEGYALDWVRVDTEEDYLEILDPNFDIILSDYSMPQFNAPRALEILQQTEYSIPFLVITGSVGEDIAVKMIKQGAADYLIKDRLTRLGPAVSKALEEHSAVQKAHRAEQALRKSERRYRAIFENTGTATLILEEDTTITLVNSEFTRLTGFEKDEVEGKMDLMDLIHPDDLDQMAAYYKARREGNGSPPHQYKFRYQHKQGEIRTAYLTVGLIGGQGQGVASFIDITEREHALHQLEASEERYRGIFNGVQDAVLVESLQGAILDVNQKACEIFGYSREELLSKRVKDLVPEDKHHVIPSRFNPDFKPSSELVESINIRSNGEEFPVEFTTEMHLLDDEPVMLVVLRDVSEKRRRERALDRRLQETSALHTLATTGTLETSEDVIIEQATEEIERILDPDFFGVMILDPNTQHLRVHPSYRNVPKNYLDAEIPLGEGVSGQVAKTGESIYLPNVHQSEHYLEIIPEIKSEICVPIKVKDNVLGVINAEDRHSKAYAEEDERFLLTLAGQLAIAIQRARLFQTVERQLNRLQTLRSIDRTISSSLDIDVTLNILLEHATNQLEVDAASILLLDPTSKTLHFKAEKGFHSQALRYTHLLIGKGYAGKAVLENRPLHVPDLNQDPGEFKDTPVLEDENFIFYYGLPLNFKGNIQGVLELYHRSSKSINNDWKHFADTLAGQAAIAIDNAEMFENLQSANLELSQAYDSTLEGWARALEMKDHETEGHSKRVVNLTIKCARALGVPGSKLIHIRRGSLLHDIGKIAIPDNILLKKGQLTDQEMAEVRKHPLYARDMLEPISYLEEALEIPLYHHERWDGSGYPFGLQAEDIPLPARIFAVIDVWDALRSNRPYRRAWPDEKALDYIQNQSGSQFDPRVVNTFLEIVKSPNYSDSPPPQKTET